MITRLYLPLIVMLMSIGVVSGQNGHKNSLSTLDTNLVKNLNDTALHYAYIDTEKSMLFANKALNYAVKYKYPKGEVAALINLSLVYYVKGEYDKSLSYSNRTSELSKQLSYNYGIIYAINNRGLIYLSQDNFKVALAEFKKAANANESIKNYKSLAANYFNIALCYIGFNDLENAEKSLGKSIELCKQSGNRRVLIMSINRLGEIAYKRRQFKKSLDFYRQAITQNDINNEWEKTYAYAGLAMSYHSLGLYRNAIIEGQKALVLAKKLNAHWDLQRVYNILHQSYLAIHDYHNAYTYLDLDKKYSDSLYNAKREKEINVMHLRQKQAENEELQHQVQIKHQKGRVNQLIIVVISVLAISLIALISIISVSNRKIKKFNRQLVKSNEDIEKQRDQIVEQNNELSELNHSKDQLFSVIGHDLRSPIVSIIQTVDLLRTNTLSPEETSHVLDNFFEKLTATATMLDNLLLWVNNQKREVSVDKTDFFLPKITQQLLLVLNFQANEKQVQIKHEQLEEAIVYADINHARIIVQNLISNAIKFTPSGGNVYIYYFIKPDKVGIVIKDTGIGIDEEKIGRLFKVMGKDISTYGTANEKGIGIGLMLVKKYADENNAQIIVNSGQEGTEFVVCFDIGNGRS